MSNGTTSSGGMTTKFGRESHSKMNNADQEESLEESIEVIAFK